MWSAKPNGLVADGQERAQEGIRAQVEAEYAEWLKKAAPEEKSRLQGEMERKIETRCRQSAPRNGLY